MLILQKNNVLIVHDNNNTKIGLTIGIYSM